MIKACLATNGTDACDKVIPRRTDKGIDVFGTGPDRDAGGRRDDDIERLRLETALDAFYNDPQTKVEDIKLRRTRVQQRLISATDMNCGIFTQRIYQIQASLNFGFGGLATVLGGAGAIVTQVDRARFLSGASSIMSGLRAEMNEDFFRRQWIEALVKAIETERGELRTEMAKHVRDDINVYPVEQAIADAIRYNDACSLVSGLSKVNEAVVIADDPAGLRAFRAAYEKAGFEADFKATVSSARPLTSSRLSSGSPASASLAIREIAEAAAQIRVYASESKISIDVLKIGDDYKTSAKAKVDTAADSLGDGSLDAPSSLKRYKDQLAAYQSQYAQLVTELGNSTDELARDEKMEFVRANDTAADIVRRAAMTLVDRTKLKIASVVDEADAESKKQEASPIKAGATSTSTVNTPAPAPAPAVA